MRALALLLACAVGAPGCARAGEPIPPQPATEAEVPAFELTLPGGLHPSRYERVRQDPRLAPALDERMIPALRADASPAERLAAFAAARADALAAYEAAVAAGEPTATPEELAEIVEGPGADPALDAFDAVCTDALRAFFLGYARWLAAALPAGERGAALGELEALAAEAFPWDPGAAKAARVDVVLVKAQAG